MRNYYKYSFNRKFHHILADGTGVSYFVFCFVLVHLVYSSFGCGTIIDREMNSISAV